jgi:Shikimate dehydrogenase substrate binding domain
LHVACLAAGQLWHARLHNFLYAAMDLNYLYKAFTTTDLKSAIAGIRALAIRGCAISMPFKEEVMQYLDHIDRSAARIRAVNTIVNDDGVLTGFNTDYTAIHKIVADRAVPLSGRICVFGSGGMTKAIVSALDEARYRAVSVVARNAKAGGLLADKYGYRWSYQRGSQEKNLPLPLREKTEVVPCIQPDLSFGEAVGLPRIPDRPSWRFVLDGFMTPWSFDAFGSGSYASKRVGFSGPTMVLSETRGLQLYWVMRGGIR